MIGQYIKAALAPALFLVAVAVLVFIHCSGCTPSESNAMGLSVENALAVAQYDQALVECQQTARQKPKELRFETYTDCEQAVSKHFCSESQALRKDWPRCSELGFAKE